MNKLLLTILIFSALTFAPVALADSSNGAYSDWVNGQPAPVVDQANNPNGYFDWTNGQPSVVFQLQSPTPTPEAVPDITMSLGVVNINTASSVQGSIIISPGGSVNIKN